LYVKGLSANSALPEYINHFEAVLLEVLKVAHARTGCMHRGGVSISSGGHTVGGALRTKERPRQRAACPPHVPVVRKYPIAKK
jgi:hypothetical protein